MAWSLERVGRNTRRCWAEEAFLSVGWSGDTEGVAVEDIPNLDEEAVGELAATYFLGKGFRHFAFIGHQDAMCV